MPRYLTQLLTLCLFAAVGFFAYADVLDDFFLSDDFVHIGAVLEGGLPVTWGHAEGGFFRPLLSLSYYFDAALWGRNPFGFHVTSLLLHVLCSFGVVLLSQALGRHASPDDVAGLACLPLAAGLVFLLHPSHTEVVSWLSGRADLLATLFCSAALYAYISFLRVARPARLILALALAACALMAKESSICLPVLVLVVGAFAGPGQGLMARAVWALRSSLPFFLLALAYIAVRTAALGAVVGGYGAARHLDFSHSVVVSQFLRFSLRALFPAVALRSFPFLESRALSPVLLAAGVLAAATVLVALARRGARGKARAFARRNAFAWWLILLFCCSLLPVINLRLNVFDTQGERTLYLPSVFSSILVAHLLARPTWRSGLQALAVLAALGFYAITLRATNENWGEAARLSREFVGQVAEQAQHDAVVVLNAPDNLMGAYIFRNGLEQALRTFQDSKAIRQVDAFGFHSLVTPRDRVQLNEQSGIFTLRLVSEGAEFDQARQAPGCVEALDRAAKVLRFRLKPCQGPRDVFVYDAGRVIRILPAPP